jgi:hypothetical protein
VLPRAQVASQSLYSDKAFYTEEALDAHLAARHADKVPPGADVCLADFCDVLQCDLLSALRPTAPLPRCSPAALAAAQRRCFALLDDCLPLLAGSDGAGSRAARAAARAHAAVAQRHCARLECDGAQPLFEPPAARLLSPVATEWLEALGLILLACSLLAYYGLLARSFGLMGGSCAGGRVGRAAGGRGRAAAARAGEFMLGGKGGARVALVRIGLALMRRWRRSRGGTAKRRA